MEYPVLLLIQILNILILILHPVLVVIALRRVKKYALSEAQVLIWTLVIIFIVIMGPIAFILTHPANMELVNSSE